MKTLKRTLGRSLPKAGIFLALAFVFTSPTVWAQTPLIVYDDAIGIGFQDWSWASHNVNNTTPVHSGSQSISVSAAYWEGLSFWHQDIDTSPYVSFSFWAHGGASGGQRLQVYAEHGGSSEPAYVLSSALPAGAWQQFTIPLSSLGINGVANFNRITLQLRSAGTSGTFYVDDIQFDPEPIPSLVNVSVSATQAVRVADARHFGVNLAMWDPYYDPPHHTTTAGLLEEMGCQTVRMPGGSLSDEYHWGSNTTLSNSWQWQASFADMMWVATNVGVQVFVTVNYGSGTAEEAAGWVRHANVTNNFGIRNWEVGNECYGTWERDTNVNHHDAYTYALRASNYIAQMKAADPSIKVGVVAAPGENSYINGYYSHPAINPRTGQTNYGWTPVLLTTLKNMGVTPDFLVHHVYPQWTNPEDPESSPDNDATLLQSTGNWAADAADLRQQITDYFGSGGSNIELVVTENNADAGAQGRQSTSLVNGLYYADSLCQLLQTEFNGFVWWDFRNGTDEGGYFGEELYGWRAYGDLGMINGPNTRHPAFYAAKLMQWFARPGEKILEVTSDYPWLSAYAARRANGSVALLVLNKFNVTNLNAQISIDGYTPIPVAVLRSYGIPNDEAVRTNAPYEQQDISTNNISNAGGSFTYTFPRLSLTLFTLTPPAPDLAALPSPPAGTVVMQIQGQQDVRYVVENSTDLINWSAVSTNTLTAGSLNITNAISFGTPHLFWRAAWVP